MEYEEFKTVAMLGSEHVKRLSEMSAAFGIIFDSSSFVSLNIYREGTKPTDRFQDPIIDIKSQ